VLSADDVRALKSDGVVVVPDVLDAREVAQGRAVLDEMYALPFDPVMDAPGYDIGSGAAGEPIMALPDGSRFVTNLVSKHPFFATLMDREPIAGLVRSLVADPLLSSLNSLEPVKGSGHQTLHRDEGPVGDEGVLTVNSLWVFDDMDEGNGATRYVPGTQHGSEMAGDDDPRVRVARASAGSVIVMNSHLLHAASTNHDGRRRRVVHVYFTKQGRKTQTDWATYVPQRVQRRLSTGQLKLLGLSSPFS
jgi:hypothetical protein